MRTLQVKEAKTVDRFSLDVGANASVLSDVKELVQPLPIEMMTPAVPMTGLLFALGLVIEPRPHVVSVTEEQEFALQRVREFPSVVD